MRNNFLISYLRAAKLSFAEFGAAVGCAPTTMHRYASGLRVPDKEMKARIEHKSRGAVPASSWIPMVLAREIPGYIESTE